MGQDTSIADSPVACFAGVGESSCSARLTAYPAAPEQRTSGAFIALLSPAPAAPGDAIHRSEPIAGLLHASGNPHPGRIDMSTFDDIRIGFYNELSTVLSIPDNAEFQMVQPATVVEQGKDAFLW